MSCPRIFESILDAPSPGLCPDVWENVDGRWVLTPAAKAHVQAVAEWARRRYGIPRMSAVVVGSITSNQYGPDSDIDVHISSPDVSDADGDALREKVKEDFRWVAPAERPELTEFAGRRVELFFQTNPYSDMMSVGCYDVADDEWLVGPELAAPDFDPYAEYYYDDVDYLGDELRRCRDNAMGLREKAVVFLRTADGETRERLSEELVSLMEEASRLFDEMRDRRSLVSGRAVDAETASETRRSREWKIADSAFKLLVELGYSEIIRMARRCLSELKDGTIGMETAARRIAEQSASQLSADVDESVASMFGKAALGAAALFGGMSYGAAAAGSASPAPTAQTAAGSSYEALAAGWKTVLSPENAKLLDALVADKGKYGGVSAVGNVLLMTRILWIETMGEPDEATDAVASVVLNRSQTKDDLVKVLMQPSAFSCVNKLSVRDVTSGKYRPLPPKPETASDRRKVNRCFSDSVKVFNRTFKSTIGNRNAYYANKGKNACSPSWAEDCDMQVGNQIFGYQREHDPKFVIPGTNTPRARKAAQKPALKIIVAKRGDTLSAIAKRHGMTVAQIIGANPQIKNPNVISPGQKVNVRT